MATKSFDTSTVPVGDGTPVKRIASTVAVNTSQTNCDILDIRGIKFLSVKPPASVTSLTFYGAMSESDTFVLINDLGTNGVVTVTASVWQSIDYTKLAPYPFIQMKSSVANGNCPCLGST